MPSPRWRALLALETRALLASRAFWIVLLLTGPLVGQAFATAVATYAEMSGGAGAPAALAQGLRPLDGFVVPTLGAYDLLVTFLAPFVAIRAVAEERASGAARFLAQAPAGLAARLLAKLAVLGAGGAAAGLAGAAALLLWRAGGGHLAVAETGAVVLGHALHALVGVGLAFAAGAVCRSAASAAIVTLAVTVGTWAVDFLAAVRGGVLARLAPFTPASALRTFEHGDVRLSVVAVLAAVAAAATALAAIALDPFAARARRWARAAAVVAALAVVVAVAARFRTSWDATEDRRNSLPRADEAVLRTIRAPVRVVARLAPEDPRRADLERNVLAKLRRVLPDFAVEYQAASGTGLFEGGAGYGEVWYAVGARRELLRSTIEPVVVAKLYELAGVAAPPPREDDAPRGYPLARPPRGGALFFFGAWPAATGLAFLLSRQPRRS